MNREPRDVSLLSANGIKRLYRHDLLFVRFQREAESATAGGISIPAIDRKPTLAGSKPRSAAVP